MLMLPTNASLEFSADAPNFSDESGGVACQRMDPATGRRNSIFRHPVIAKPAFPQSKLLNGVLVVIRVAVNTPVTPKVGLPLMSYAWNVNLPE